MPWQSESEAHTPPPVTPTPSTLQSETPLPNASHVAQVKPSLHLHTPVALLHTPP
jgi:hypothetical protein